MVKTNNPTNKKPSEAKRIILIALGVLLMGLVIFLEFAFWVGSPKEIIAVADKFQPPASWKLESEWVQPPKTFCIDGGSCPGLGRQWLIPDSLSYDQLLELFRDAGWQYTVKDDDCIAVANARKIANTDNNYYSCHISAKDALYSISFYVSTPDSNPEKLEASLFVNPR